jgi:predicted deacylase
LRPGFHHRRLERDGVGFEVFVWRGGPGPTLLVNGATHGDEYEGPTLLRQWAEKWKPRALHGTVVFVPVLNETAFFAAQRCSPVDGLNLARVFPGSRRGKPTQRLACLFDQQLLAQVSHYIDLHSAGATYELLPWGGYCTTVPKRIEKTQREMTACFDRFWNWSGPSLPGRTLSAARERGIPAIYTECRGAGSVHPDDLAAIDSGLRNVVLYLGLIKGKLPRLRPQRSRITRDPKETHLQVHHLAPHAGIFVPQAKLGRKVRKGDVLGQLYGLAGKTTVMHAEGNGRIVLHRRQRSVSKGDALATLAPI